ncbi:MAG: malonyl-ACP O-methyltransferase BioC [Candidatus Porifericomitaceae bacterium WSBS_2022_MAG_OTU9]
MNQPRPLPMLRKISKSFGRAAESYDDVAALQRKVAGRLVERLSYFRVEANNIIDLGCGTGFCAEALLQQYPKASCLCLDLSVSMLSRARGKGVGRHHVCASATDLPFADDSVDIVVSSMMLHWCPEPSVVVGEVQRILRPGGVFVFSSCAPGTLRELCSVWQAAGLAPPVYAFPDINDLASTMSAAGYADPVLDRDIMQLLHQDVKGLVRVLRSSGVSPQPGAPVGSAALRKILSAYEKHRLADGQLPASFEIVYGHGFAPAHKLGDAVVSLRRLRDNLP